jgi:hypothetical protein
MTPMYRRALLSADSVFVIYHGPKIKLENERNERFLSFKTHADQERAIKQCNPAPST